jgi:hypothetical protein
MRARGYLPGERIYHRFLREYKPAFALARKWAGFTVWPVLVVVAVVDAEDVLEVMPAEDEDSIEAVGADCADPAFGVGVGVRRLVARLLSRPVAVRIGGARDVLDPSRRERDEEEDVKSVARRRSRR